MEKSKKMGILAKLSLLFTTIVWGSSFFILKNTIDALPTFFVLATRFSIAAVIAGLIFITSFRRFNKFTVLHGFILSLCLVGAYTLQTLGLKETTPSKNAFLTTVYVVIVPFMYWAFFKGRPRWNNIVAALICLIGIGLVSLDGEFHVERGDIMTICCGILFALQIVFIKKFSYSDEQGQLIFWEMLFTAAAFWIISLAAEGTPPKIESGQIFPILYLSVLATGITQITQQFGQKYTSPNSASLILSLEAVFGVAFSMIFYHETLTLKMGIGFAIIFIAVLVSEINWGSLTRKKEGGI